MFIYVESLTCLGSFYAPLANEFKEHVQRVPRMRPPPPPAGLLLPGEYFVLLTKNLYQKPRHAKYTPATSSLKR